MQVFHSNFPVEIKKNANSVEMGWRHSNIDLSVRSFCIFQLDFFSLSLFSNNICHKISSTFPAAQEVNHIDYSMLMKYQRKHWLKFHVNKNEDIKVLQKKKRESQQNELCKTSNKRVKLDEVERKTLITLCVYWLCTQCD